ncbi:MAG TPA: hypothetical protein PKA91_14485, partial [Leptospiraceae bacterium]|nr:hypothetical protein [Leptospiraceae bacterium]
KSPSRRNRRNEGRGKELNKANIAKRPRRAMPRLHVDIDQDRTNQGNENRQNETSDPHLLL